MIFMLCGKYVAIISHIAKYDAGFETSAILRQYMPNISERYPFCIIIWIKSRGIFTTLISGRQLCIRDV